MACLAVLAQSLSVEVICRLNVCCHEDIRFRVSYLSNRYARAIGCCWRSVLISLGADSLHSLVSYIHVTYCNQTGTPCVFVFLQLQEVGR
jgi:hypothetical protein